MEIIKQTKQGILLELTPMELEVLRSAMVKEGSARRRAWNKVNPQFPEELIYHAVLKDTSEQMKVQIYNGVKMYQRWGILK